MMKRPLCCVCMAFVAAVFVYLFSGLVPAPPVGEAQGSRLTITGELYNKEYKKDSLILYLRHIKKKNINPISNETQTTEYDYDTCVMCYMDSDAMISDEDVRLGAWIVVEGEVSLFPSVSNPGEFDAAAYYRTLGIAFRLFDARVLAKGTSYNAYQETLYRLRQTFGDVYDFVLSEKDAAVLKAMILGEKSGLDAESKSLFQRSGISHILAISGLHISLIGMLAYGMFKKINVPRIPAVVFCIMLMSAYGDLIGMSSSAFRAILMFGMKLLADMLRRTYDMLTALSLAAVLLLMEEPLYLQQTGFLLSFGAVLGICLFSELVSPDLECIQSRFLRKMTAAVSGSLSIFLVHFPILLCSYYEFPVYSFLLNLIVVPAMSVVLVMGLLCLLFGSLGGIFLGVAKLSGLVCHVLLALFETAGSSSLKLPFAQWIVGRPDNWKIAVFYVAVLSLYFLFCYAKKASKSRRCAALHMKISVPYWYRLLCILLAVSFLSFHGIYDTRVTFLDVGQGDAIWVESTSGKHYLIDAGSSSESQIGQYTLLPYLKYMGTSSIDAVFLTHLDEDHISGVCELLEGYDRHGGASGVRIDRIIVAQAVIKDAPYQMLRKLCEEKGIALLYAKAGDVIGDKALSFEVLHPDKDYVPQSRNAYSLVLKLSVNDGGTRFCALLTGDVEADGEAEVIDYLRAHGQDGQIDLYKAAHHGSKYSNTWELLELLRPTVTVISCGENNRYGHPHAQAVAQLEQVGSRIAVTKDVGAVMIRIRNGRWRMEYGRSGVS